MRLTPEHLLQGYASGIFPMAESRDASEIYWVDPKVRGIIPLEGFHISRSLTRQIRAEPYQITVNRAFEACVAECANRPETWINPEIAALYTVLHTGGYAHSLEVWDGEVLVGGVYGVHLGAAFFGESMFSRRSNTSKIALAYLVHRLRAGGFTLFDTQFVTPHLLSLGATEIPRADYHARLSRALEKAADFHRAPAQPDHSEVLEMHRKTQTS